jgi:murein DD-endopeptidase MepM/ murein hydrolase activator NlpD
VSGPPQGMTRAGLPVLLALVGLSACTEPSGPAPEPAPPEIVLDHPEPIGPEPPPVHEYHVGEIRNGDSLSTALSRQGVSAAEVHVLAAALKGALDVSACHPGDWFEVYKDEAGALERFRYVAGRDVMVLAYRGPDGGWAAYREPVLVTTSTHTVEGVVDHSLYLAVDAAGEQPWLTLTLVDIFAWDVDFFTETRKGDRFRVVLEKRFVDGEFLGYGNVLAAEYYLAEPDQRFRAFRYTFEDGKVGYYRQDGKAVEKAFLKSPIKFASITSRYGLRRHPILQYVRAHRGVDYGAPMGTAVWSVGDGVVTFAGNKGGYGRVVIVRHANSLESRYAHLKAYGSGITRGARVRQKQVIGYVGKSGLATGPHLHFEVLRGGHHTNPLSVAAPPAPPIPDAELPRFEAAVAPWRAALDEASELTVSARGEESTP